MRPDPIRDRFLFGSLAANGRRRLRDGPRAASLLSLRWNSVTGLLRALRRRLGRLRVGAVLDHLRSCPDRRLDRGLVGTEEPESDRRCDCQEAEGCRCDDGTRQPRPTASRRGDDPDRLPDSIPALIGSRADGRHYALAKSRRRPGRGEDCCHLPHAGFGLPVLSATALARSEVAVEGPGLSVGQLAVQAGRDQFVSPSASHGMPLRSHQPGASGGAPGASSSLGATSF